MARGAGISISSLLGPGKEEEETNDNNNDNNDNSTAAADTSNDVVLLSIERDSDSGDEPKLLSRDEVVEVLPPVKQEPKPKKPRKPRMTKKQKLEQEAAAAAAAAAGNTAAVDTTNTNANANSATTSTPAPNTANANVKASTPASAQSSPYKSTSIMNLVNETDTDPGPQNPRTLLPSPMTLKSQASSEEKTPTVATTQSPTPSAQKSTPASTKPKAAPRKKATANTNSTTNGEKKEKKQTKKSAAAAAKKDEEKKEDPQPLSFNQVQNMNLKQPKPNSSLPPPKLIDLQKSPASNNQISASPKGSSAEPNNKPEPIVAIHVPLYTKDEEPGSTQVVFNVMKMCEDKYGWKNMHPNASKFAMDIFNDDDMDDDDDDMEDDDENEDKEKEKEKEKEPKEPVKIDGRKLQKGKPKIGQYDINDPFIDDTEMAWEEQRASTKDGFFVYWGPLVEEGQSARIERADGTIKRGRKRVANTTNNGNSNNAKRKQPALAPKPLKPLVPSSNTTPAPQENNQQTK